MVSADWNLSTPGLKTHRRCVLVVRAFTLVELLVVIAITLAS